jgi:beta-glucosidase/6-phospho-beta-glucosidase/beta-galactosidase
MQSKEDVRSFIMCAYWIDLSDRLSSTPNEDCMKKLHPWKVDISTNHIKAHKHFRVSTSWVRVLDVYSFPIDYLC